MSMVRPRTGPPTIGVSPLLHQVPQNILLFGGDRWLDCVNHGLSISRCALFEEGRVSELNPGCFDELDQANSFAAGLHANIFQIKNNQTRVYCRLNCEESDEATVLRKEPSDNHICSVTKIS